MTEIKRSFKAGVDFRSILPLISKQIYETPNAFIRENVQNAVDAVLIQTGREGVSPRDERFRIDVTVNDRMIKVRDNGNGMTESELQDYYWTMGASGKRTPEARSVGCVGTFGIGGFANLGVCETLEVVSQIDGAEHGTLTRLSQEDIEAHKGAIPDVASLRSELAAPRGTIVIGHLEEVADVDLLKGYLLDFVRYVPVAVYFNEEKLSQTPFSDVDQRANYDEIRDVGTRWGDGSISVEGQLYEDQGHTLAISIEDLHIDGEKTDLTGFLRFENGQISGFKNGFKLCTTQVSSTIGVTGRLDCNRFVPTAGRDSFDSETTQLLSRIVSLLEKTSVECVLQDPNRIAQHTRIFRYVLNHGMVGDLDNVVVRLADGSENALGSIKRRSENGVAGVFYGTSQNQTLHQIMQARGHTVVLLSSDRYRQRAERQYLEQYCGAKPLDGVVECSERYEDLNLFERFFLSELENNISRSYEIDQFVLIPGCLTEDIPVLVEERSGRNLEIVVDVRHPEVTKMEPLGFTSILYSLIGTFCREYLGPSLKKWSPRFFGDGSLNLDLMFKRRSELWVLVKDDVEVIRRNVQRQVVTKSDIETVVVAGDHLEPEITPQKTKPRILRIIDDRSTVNVNGYYIRVPESAFIAYGDLLQTCESRGLVWHANQITYVASDSVSAAFQYQIELDEIVAPISNGIKRAEGALELDRPLQEILDGIYFPIPSQLTQYLVPVGDGEIRLELQCDWIDMRTAKHWLSPPAAA